MLSSLLSAHTWAVIGLCSLPLLVWIPLWLLDADRPPSNEITHEQGQDRDLTEMRLAA